MHWLQRENSVKMSAKHYTIILSSGTVITVLFAEATAQQQLECDKFAASGWGSCLDEGEILSTLR